MTDDAIDAILSAPPPPSVEAEADAGRLRARNALVEQHRRLVYSVARGYARSGHDLEDLAQLGFLGLIRAAEDFDPAGGFAFSTVAVFRIRSAIVEGLGRLRGPIHVPAGAWKLRREFRRRAAEMEAKLGRPPTFDETADSMGLTPLRREIVRAAQAVDRARGSNVLDFDLVGDEAAEPAEQDPRLRRALRSLPRAQREVIALRYGLADGEARTLAETGRELGMCRQRAYQHERGALARLRAVMGV